jgi:hypothetical protein
MLLLTADTYFAVMSNKDFLNIEKIFRQKKWDA